MIMNTYMHLLRIRQFLNRAVHAFLQDCNLFIFLIAKAVHVSAGIIQFDQEIVNLKLLSLWLLFQQ